ncbi:MAG: beta-ketoacyl-ACP synthase II [gamma proteobacterium symbiont of Bathyaustriella thionipta]|nr:beta-ketoacyl-ACP synthase II [gamma proteobacterium symbiont of Bathyaustriella thionipta]MCU7949122.1 beta-ketoacyl-ACP synthase II [gamma proteobacterium symbiont of Bathyaustriella thionipta]MCU7954433.1 beta-ketoacyl-ACP synthase II [gamma proteobacterium symbiont of Bathyaustriella thionipta]MCU7955705.1 beta-ketoacyl-ACP synthase II [gamma proteobacterium symbiont of Bathyaustriella thionipta]MCU7966201.1 beta-ketoacyl-ACP synthase II [gamma proteobacterium symbiont of Bathyaustriella
MTKRRVVITGMGMVTPVGLNVSESWENILAGKSGIKLIDHLDTEPFSVKFGGSIRNFDISDYLSPKESKKMDTFIHYGMAAGIQAIEDSGLEITEQNAWKIGVHIGSGIGGISGIEKGHSNFLRAGPRKVSPFFVPSNIINMISGNLSVKYGLKGPNLSMATACATATHSIGDAARIIEYGDADVMVTGGAEMASSHTGLAGFASARALSTRNDDPETASRPWDRDRDGFVLSDGAGVVVLEEYEFAKARGAKIYAEVLGFGMSGDAFHMTLPSKGGEGASRCMDSALRNAGLNPQQINYINAHGTSTPAGDLAETEAAKRTFGDYAYNLTMSSTKSMTGHLLGAAGGIEAIFTALAIRDQVAPPTINLQNPSDDCDLDYAPLVPKEMKIDYAISNSFGFGGTNGTLIFGKI